MLPLFPDSITTIAFAAAIVTSNNNAALAIPSIGLLFFRRRSQCCSLDFVGHCSVVFLFSFAVSKISVLVWFSSFRRRGCHFMLVGDVVSFDTSNTVTTSTVVNLK